MERDASPAAASPSNDDATVTPRWVVVLGLITAVVIVVLVVALFAGGGLGEHGPGRHQVPTSVSEQSRPGA